ncbi:MAG: AMP-binding protein [Burkholderiales bacterium]|nr:AMP-binding protein [Burkholderiales bacterium]
MAFSIAHSGVPDAGALPFSHPTVLHALADAARRTPDLPAISCEAETLTYRQYAACVDALARELIALGAEGGRVALLMGNSLDIAIATFAAQAALAQVVPLNPAYTAHELTPILANARPCVLLFDAACAGVVASAAQEVPHRIVVGEGARLTRWSDAPPPAVPLPLPAPESLSTLQYTGGTTGRSKGVDLTHAAVAVNVAQREALLPTLPEAERVLAITPLFHVYSVSMGLYLAAYARSHLVIMPRYRPEDVLATIARERITLLAGSPTIFIGLMACPAFASADLSSLRLCYSGSAPLSAATLERWEAATGCGICEGYGQSEAGPVLTYNPQVGRRKVGTVGFALPQTQVEVVDVETGTRILAAGEVGEIRARGPQIMCGYRGLADETAAALRDGWLYTGDLGEFDADGYLTIRDRKKDMVIVGGYNVYPREVENALLAHPGVAEAAVVGAPDTYRGERLVAFVVPRTAATPAAALEADLSAYLAERLTRYKLPGELRLVAALPKTTVGKIDKIVLRTTAATPA